MIGVAAQVRTLFLSDLAIPIDCIGARIARICAHIPCIPVPISLRTRWQCDGIRALPFTAGDLIKLYIAAVLVPGAWSLLNLRQRRDEQWT